MTLWLKQTKTLENVGESRTTLRLNSTSCYIITEPIRRKPPSELSLVFSFSAVSLLSVTFFCECFIYLLLVFLLSCLIHFFIWLYLLNRIFTLLEGLMIHVCCSRPSWFLLWIFCYGTHEVVWSSERGNVLFIHYWQQIK